MIYPICQEVKELNTIVDQKNTLSGKILEFPGIERTEKEYNKVMEGKFICKNIETNNCKKNFA